MFPRAGLWGVLLCLACRPSPGAEQVVNGHRFTLPDGFVIELVAESPLVDRPITADFDEMGRLYVADSSGSNDPVQKQLEERPHRIVRLEDSDGDGRFDKSVVFADGMMFPEGTLCFDGSLYVAAPPSLWKLTDTDHDGIADRREEWFAGKTLTGCANDLHGPYLGPDGWIYWCKGAFAEQSYEQPSRQPLVTRAAHIFRRRADGTGPVESVMTGGMDNPVDVAFTAGGERLFTTTFLQNPGGGLRDGVIHAVYGGVYGKVHNVTDFHPRTGDLLPPLIHMGAAAPCGLLCYESPAFGQDYTGNLFACQFNMHKVSRHELKTQGATFQSSDSDFVVSDNIDFHPTDVVEAADGSLIICDTGGWYKLCCPTSQLAKPDIKGAVYRVRRAGAKPVSDPHGRQIHWNQLSMADAIRKLDDERPAVRRMAIRHLVARGDQAVAPLTTVLRELKDGTHLDDGSTNKITESQRPRAASSLARLNAVWTLTRLDLPQARSVARGALGDPDATVRQAALHSASLWKDRDAAPRVLPLLQQGTPTDQRLAAEVLGRVQATDAVAALLEAAARAPVPVDRVLEHALTYALIEIADPAQTAAGLRSPVPGARRVAMIALDQMPSGKLDPGQVVSLLSSNEGVLKDTALWLVTRHPEWGDALAGYLKQQLTQTPVDNQASEELVQLLARFAGTASVQELLAGRLAPLQSSAADQAHLISLAAMRQSGLKQMPAKWIAPLTTLLGPSPVEVRSQAIAVVRALPLPKTGIEELVAALRQVALDPQSPAEVRIEALAALPAGTGDLDPVLFEVLVSHLGEQTSVGTRSSAVEALGRSRLSIEQQGALADAIPDVGPLELTRLLGIFESSSDPLVGRRLISGLKRSPVLTSLRVDSVKPKLAKFPAVVQSEAEELYSAINMEAGQQQQRLDTMVASLGEGDIRRGQLVFQNSKAACSACHAIGYLGGNIGPDLSRIGKIRTERDLLESLLFPSVSFVRSYEPVLIVTSSGKTHTGLVRRETADEITLATGAKEEARIQRSEIEEIRPGTVSIMPAGLDTQLTREQIADLVAFLKSRQ